VDGLEALVGELQQQARLADACSKAKPSRVSTGRPSASSQAGKWIRLDLHLAAAAAAGCEARGSNRGTEERRGTTGRTCVADDDVLEEVGVRHLRWAVAGLFLRGPGTKKSCGGISRAWEGIRGG
jgi:hypothetical protein